MIDGLSDSLSCLQSPVCIVLFIFGFFFCRLIVEKAQIALEDQSSLCGLNNEVVFADDDAVAWNKFGTTCLPGL